MMGVKLPREMRQFIISHVNYKNCHSNVWREISRYNEQVKNPGCKCNLSSMILKGNFIGYS